MEECLVVLFKSLPRWPHSPTAVREAQYLALRILTNSLLPNPGSLGRSVQGRKLPHTWLSAVSITRNGLPFRRFPLMVCIDLNAGELFTLFALQQWQITRSGERVANLNKPPPLDKLLLLKCRPQLHLRVTTTAELLTFPYRLIAKGHPLPLQNGPPCYRNPREEKLTSL